MRERGNVAKNYIERGVWERQQLRVVLKNYAPF